MPGASRGGARLGAAAAAAGTGNAAAARQLPAGAGCAAAAAALGALPCWHLCVEAPVPTLPPHPHPHPHHPPTHPPTTTTTIAPPPPLPQIMADIMTVKEHIGRYEDVKVGAGGGGREAWLHAWRGCKGRELCRCRLPTTHHTLSPAKSVAPPPTPSIVFPLSFAPSRPPTPSPAQSIDRVPNPPLTPLDPPV